MSEIVFSPSQENAANAFRKFILEPGTGYFVLSGYAGTGKSFLVKELVRIVGVEYRLLRMIKPNLRKPEFLFTATTNKAAAVLEELAGGQLGEAMTIHSCLALTLRTDFSSGQKYLVPGKRRPQRLDNKILVIDEASMINKQLLGYIGKYTKNAANCKVVFVGDPYQLPPVNEDVCPIFSNNTMQLHMLTDIQRQAADSPIISYAHKFREVLDNPKQNWPKVPECEDIIQYNEPLPFINKCLSTFKQAHEEGIAHMVKYLAWTNRDVIAAGRKIREHLGYKGSFAIGETLKSNSPILGTDVTNESLWKIADYTDLEKTVLYTPTIAEGHKIQIPCKRLHLHPVDNSRAHPETVLQPENWQEVNSKVISKLKRDKCWQLIYAIQENLADLRTIYSQTVHKSQGSTYHEVFINVLDIDANSNWESIARLMYVAITRAKFRVHILGQLSDRLIPMDAEAALGLFDDSAI